MIDLKRVIGIIDMDGFMVEKVFYCKELGIWRVGDVYASSYVFDMGLEWGQLSERDRRQCLYVMKYVHRLPFTVPWGVRSRELSELPGILTEFFEGNKGKGRDVMAYKGGHFEKDLLGSLGIPCIDLEEYGCPKAGGLFRDLGWLETCHNHIGKGMAYEHCPKVETEAYGSWITNVSIENVRVIGRPMAY